MATVIRSASTSLRKAAAAVQRFRYDVGDRYHGSKVPAWTFWALKIPNAEEYARTWRELADARGYPVARVGTLRKLSSMFFVIVALLVGYIIGRNDPTTIPGVRCAVERSACEDALAKARDRRQQLGSGLEVLVIN